MIKVIFISSLLLSACQKLNRKTPSQLSLRGLSSLDEVTDCIISAKKLLSPSKDNKALKEYIKRSDQLSRINEKTVNDPYEKYYNEVDYHAENGRKLYLDNSNFFTSLKIQRGVSGVEFENVYTTTFNGEELFIKEFNANTDVADISISILNSKILQHMGIGPKTDLIRVDGIYYLVMEKLSGVNIKEVLMTKWSTRNTRKKIEKMLQYKTANKRESVRQFTRNFLSNKEFIERIYYIQDALIKMGFYNIFDFQFMVDISKGPNSIMIIDSGAFIRSSKAFDDKDKEVKATIDLLLTQLREISK